MKRYSPISLLWLFATPLSAADLSPSLVIPNELSLGRPGDRLTTPGDVQVGFRFEQAKNFRLDPTTDDHSPSLFIQREIQLGMRVWDRLDLGLAVRSSQESQPLEALPSGEKSSHLTKAMSFGLWTQYHILESSTARTTLSLQFLPGQASASSFHQASQDRTILGLSQEWTPSPWFRSAVYLLGARRQAERYQSNYQLGQEAVWGIRLSAGPETLHLFGDAEARQLEVTSEVDDKLLKDKTQGRTYRLGIGSKLGNFDLRLATSIPEPRRYLGIPERGLTVSLSYRFSAETRRSESATSNTDQRQELPAPESQVVESNAPTTSTSLEESELDEFQILERKMLDESKNTQESPEEAAERELRALRDAEKQAEALAQEDIEKRRAEIQEQMKKEMDDIERLYNEYRLDVEDEVNQFALPDAEELSWQGLQNDEN